MSAIASLGTMIEGKFGMELLVVVIGVGIILLHLDGITLGSDEVDEQWSTLTEGHFSGWQLLRNRNLGDSHYGHLGGATIIDEVEASAVAGQNCLEERGVHKG